MVLCIFKSVIHKAIIWSNCMCIPSHCEGGARKMLKERMMVKEDTKREELKGSIHVHIPKALLEGAGTLTVSPPGSMAVKVPGCERWRPRPELAAPLLDTSLSFAACGFETNPHFVGHHEFHLGKSIAHIPQHVRL